MTQSSPFHKTFIQAGIAFYLSSDPNMWKKELDKAIPLVESNQREILIDLAGSSRERFNAVVCNYIDKL